MLVHVTDSEPLLEIVACAEVDAETLQVASLARFHSRRGLRTVGNAAKLFEAGQRRVETVYQHVDIRRDDARLEVAAPCFHNG